MRSDFLGEKILFVLLRRGARRARGFRHRPHRPVASRRPRGTNRARVSRGCLYTSLFTNAIRCCTLHSCNLIRVVQLDTRAHSPRISLAAHARRETPRRTRHHATRISICGTHVPRKRTTKVQSSRCHVHNHPEVSGRLWIRT